MGQLLAAIIVVLNTQRYVAANNMEMDWSGVSISGRKFINWSRTVKSMVVKWHEIEGTFEIVEQKGLAYITSSAF